MDDRLKSTLRRFAWTLVYAGIGSACAAVLTLNLDSATPKVVIGAAVTGFISGVMYAAQKFLTWTEAS